jgi:phosphate starvation-inducible PhoH-like protein
LKPKPVELRLTPVDNKRLSNLCGALDENLRQIETALDISISRRGERFMLRGDPRQAARGARIIERFYGDAQRSLTLDDIQLGLVEFARTPAQSARKPREAPAPEDPPLVARRADLRARTPRQRDYIRNILDNDITFAIGPAGTGKTYLAVACAADALERDAVKRIVLVRPAVEAGERLGFLPGDLAQKVDPYLRPLYDALYDILGFDKVQKLLERSAIELAPLAYMRGRTLNHAFVILDEEMKMFLTRMGFGSKSVITGDVTQVDLPRGARSGLAEARDILKDVRGIAFTTFLSEDVVRHPLVQRIVDAYDSKPQE